MLWEAPWFSFQTFNRLRQWSRTKNSSRGTTLHLFLTLQQIPDSGAPGCHSDLINLVCGATLITSRPRFPAYLDLNICFSAVAVVRITADDPQRSLHFPVQSAWSLLRRSGGSVLTATLLKEQRLVWDPQGISLPSGVCVQLSLCPLLAGSTQVKFNTLDLDTPKTLV